MKLSVQREDLLQPLSKILGVVERRQTLPMLANVLCETGPEGLRLTATDLEVELRAERPLEGLAPGALTLPARKLHDICRALPEESEIHIEASEGRATVRSGRSRFTLSTQPAAEFPRLELDAGTAALRLPVPVLLELIERTHFAMAHQDVRYYLNGLLLEILPDRVVAVATDGHRLALAEAPLATGQEEPRQVIVPRKGVQELLRLLGPEEGEAHLQLTENHIRITLPGLQFTSKLIDGRFPDYRRVIPRDNDKRLVADRESLRQSLGRTSILSNEKYRGIRLSLSPGSLKIQAHNPEQEEAEEELGVEFEGPPLDIGFNVTYLLDALDALEGEKVRIELSDPNSSCLIRAAEGNSAEYVVMPMRL
ncbi:MAG: DNA polymerase III subunit beta [Gammaproteobacteria bacterium]|nr:MAG: DNA polymerase III subunit beta [Gammaproteobacteria bacterium]